MDCLCKEKTPVSANFTITEKHFFPVGKVLDLFEPYDTDTVYSQNVLFTALEPEANYTWLIGIEELHDSIVQRSNFPFNVEIPITLIVEKEPDNFCFPNDDGRDTLTRMLYRSNNCEHIRVEGEYLVYPEGSPQDTFTVVVDNCPPYPIDVPQLGPYFLNIPNGCEYRVTSWLRSRRLITFILGDSGFCNGQHPYGQIILDENLMDISIRYGFLSGINEGNEFILKGKRE